MRAALMSGALAVCLAGAAQAGDRLTPAEKSTTVRVTPESTEVVTPAPGSDELAPPMAEPPIEEKSTTVIVNPAPPAPVVVVDPTPKKVEDKNDMRGVTVLLGGGVEGYTGDFAPGIKPGPSWGVTAAFKPTKVLGLELGYTGAVNELSGNLAEGADLVRNGGQLVATVGLSATPVQPYLLGGVGISKYDVRGSAPAAGYRSDVSGNIPLGGGLRTHIGHFTADARFDYNILIDNELAFAPGTEIAGQQTSIGAGGRYQGVLSVGSTF